MSPRAPRTGGELRFRSGHVRVPGPSLLALPGRPDLERLTGVSLVAMLAARVGNLDLHNQARGIRAQFTLHQNGRTSIHGLTACQQSPASDTSVITRQTAPVFIYRDAIGQAKLLSGLFWGSCTKRDKCAPEPRKNSRASSCVHACLHVRCSRAQQRSEYMIHAFSLNLVFFLLSCPAPYNLHPLLVAPRYVQTYSAGHLQHRPRAACRQSLASPSAPRAWRPTLLYKLKHSLSAKPQSGLPGLPCRFMRDS